MPTTTTTTITATARARRAPHALQPPSATGSPPPPAQPAPADAHAVAAPTLPPSRPRHPPSLLADLGVIGFERVEPVLLGALISGEPLLLIGPHGTGKSYLLCRLAAALGLEFRHYNASLLNYDDLVGYPVPDPSGSLRFVQTPASIWGANAVFFDEVSRCRPDLQNKLFPIVHERKVQGIELRRLEYRWAAMNPPHVEDDADADPAPDGADGAGSAAAEAYLGSEPLDAALADRFAFVVETPRWEWLSEEQQLRVILAGDGPVCPAAAQRLRERVAAGRGALEALRRQDGPRVAAYVRAVVRLLAEAGLALSPRRAGILLRNVLAVHAAWTRRRADVDLADSAWKALEHSLPQRACGRPVDQARLSAAHREAWRLAGLGPADPRRLIALERDPLRRAALAAATLSLSREDLSGVVADALAALPPGGRHALAAFLFEGGAAARLCAAVAEQAAALYARAVTPVEVTESLSPMSSRYQTWQRIAPALAILPADDADVQMAENLLLGMFAEKELSDPRDVDAVLAAFASARRALPRWSPARPADDGKGVRP